MSVNEAADQGVACQELDCFANVFNRREGCGWVAFGNEFKYRDPLLRADSAGPLPCLGARALGLSILRLSFKIVKDLLRIIHFAGTQHVTLGLASILKELATQLRAFGLSCDGFYHKCMRGLALPSTRTAMRSFNSSGSLRLVMDIPGAPLTKVLTW